MNSEKRDEDIDDDSIAELHRELRRIAGGLMRGDRAAETLGQATALVHELFTKWWGKGYFAEADRDRAKFLSLAAGSMRNILRSRARAKATAKRRAGNRIPFEDAVEMLRTDPEALLEVDTLVDEIAAATNLPDAHRKARIAELKIFGGYLDKDIAALLEVSPATVSRDIEALRVWFQRRRQLAAGGEPG